MASGMVFVGTDLRAVDRDAVSTVIGRLGARIREIAAVRPTAWEGFRAAIDARLRLRRFGAYVADATRQLQAGTLARADESWRWAEYEGKRLAEAGSLRALLGEECRGLGVEANDEQLAWVQRAIVREWLPLTALAAVLDGGTTDAGRQLATAWLRRSSPAPAVVHATVPWWRLAFTRIDATPHGTFEPLHAAMRDALLDRSWTGSDRYHLVAAYLGWWSRAIDASKVSSAWAKEVLEHLREVSRAGPQPLEAARAEGSALRACGEAHARAARPGDSAIAFAEALTVDPIDERSRRGLMSALELIDRRVRSAEDAARLGTLTASARSDALELIAQQNRAVEAFQEGPVLAERFEIFERRCLNEVCVRFGLDPTERASVELVTALNDLIRESVDLATRGEDVVNDAEVLDVVRRRVQASQATFASLDGALLVRALAHLRAPFDPHALVESLEPAAPPATRLTTQRDARPLRGAPSWKLRAVGWASTPRHAVWKLAAAAGLMLALHGGVVIAQQRARARRVESNYAATLESAARTDDAATLASGRRFIDEAARDDARRSQVRSLLEPAMVRETIRLVRRGRVGEARALLATYRPLTRDVDGATAPSSRQEVVQ